MERITTIQTASVITQPTDATERLTLVEKLEEYHQLLYERWCDNHKHPYDEGAMDAVEKAINIVKQHQVESGWVSVKTPPPKRGNYLVYTKDYRMFDCRYSDGWHKNTIGYKDILYWKPIQPPSEV